MVPRVLTPVCTADLWGGSGPPLPQPSRGSCSWDSGLRRPAGTSELGWMVGGAGDTAPEAFPGLSSVSSFHTGVVTAASTWGPVCVD